MIWSRKKGEMISLEVEGIHCTQCEATIKIALHKVPGVRRITIRQKRHIQVEIAPGAAVSVAELGAAIESTGYRVSQQPAV